jgi:hypothetical protein
LQDYLRVDLIFILAELSSETHLSAMMPGQNFLASCLSLSEMLGDTVGYSSPVDGTQRRIDPMADYNNRPIRMITDYHASYYAHELSCVGGVGLDRIGRALFGSSGVWEKNNVSLFREGNKTFRKTAVDLCRTLEMPSGKGVHGINGFLPADAGPPHLYVNALASGPFQSATSS